MKEYKFLFQKVSFLLSFTLCLYIASPFFNTAIVSQGLDAQTYLFYVSDFIIQWRNDVFPIYAPTTYFSSNGASVFIMAPYLFYLAAILDSITLHEFGSATLLNGTIAASIIGGWIAMYMCMRKLFHSVSQFQASIISALYISSPAAVTLCFYGDFYHSIMTMPFIPIFFYGMMKSLKLPNLKHSFITAAGLYLVSLAHFAFGFLCICTLVFICIINFCISRKKIKGVVSLFLTFSIYIILSCWYFYLILYSEPKSDSIDSILTSLPTSYDIQLLNDRLRSISTLFFSPVTSENIGAPRIGLTWFVLGAISVSAFLYQLIESSINKHSISCFIKENSVWFSLIFLFLPFSMLLIWVPFFSDLFWPHIPKFIISIISLSPPDRASFLLTAAIGVLIGLTLNSLKDRGRKLLVLACLIGVCWNIFEERQYLGEKISRANFDQSYKLAMQQLTSNLKLPENSSAFSNFYLTSGIDARFLEPTFESRLLHSDFTFLDSTLNQLKKSIEDIPVSKSPFSPAVVLIPPTRKNFNFSSSSTSIVIDGPVIEIGPNEKIFLSFKIKKILGYSGALIISGKNFYRELVFDEICSYKNCIAATSIWHSLPKIEILKTKLYLTNANSSAGISYDINDFSLLKYSNKDLKLPLTIESLLPYMAVVSNMPENGYFESNKNYSKTYHVKVNGAETSYLRTPMNRMGVPIKKGQSIIEFEHKTPFLLKLFFIISLALFIFLFLLFFISNKIKKKI